MIERVTVSLGDEWPEAVSDGLELPCAMCGAKVHFDYHVSDYLWNNVVPEQFRLGVICLPCLDSLASASNFNVGDYLETVQFTGIEKTVTLIPRAVYYWGKAR